MAIFAIARSFSRGTINQAGRGCARAPARILPELRGPIDALGAYQIVFPPGWRNGSPPGVTNPQMYFHGPDEESADVLFLIAATSLPDVVGAILTDEDIVESVRDAMLHKPGSTVAECGVGFLASRRTGWCRGMVVFESAGPLGTYGYGWLDGHTFVSATAFFRGRPASRFEADGLVAALGPSPIEKPSAH